MTYSGQVAAEVRARMARLGATRTDLLNTMNPTGLGMGTDALGRRLRGEIPFDVDELAAVANALDTTPVAILTDVDDNNVPRD